MTIADTWTLKSLIQAYCQHQRRTRGLHEHTLHSYARFVRLFVLVTVEDDAIDPARFSPADVTAFFAAMRDRFSPRSMKTVRTALRSFFRFLRVEGFCDKRLEAAIPAVAHWRLSTLPRYLSDSQLDQVLASLKVCGPCGHRDRALVQCLATLGLRPGELADLRLEDIDWRRGTVHLRVRKTRRGAVLPLPPPAARAIVAYLRHERPATTERRMFVQHLGAHRGHPISSNAVSAAAVRTLRRAGIDPPIAGAYVFRHTLASRLVRRGASLKEVADCLGHRNLDTTTIYTKLDLPALRDVALPWPECLR